MPEVKKNEIFSNEEKIIVVWVKIKATRTVCEQRASVFVSIKHYVQAAVDCVGKITERSVRFGEKE